MPPLVFLTGASGGIGQALALAYYRQGWSLALCARRGTALEDLVRTHALDPQRVRLYAADVTDTDAMVRAAHQCLAGQGLPEVVIAAAGFSTGVDAACRADIDVLAQLLATNTTGLAATLHPFIAPMRARGRGTLVGVASVAGWRGLPGHGGYCASKAGAIALCESLRVELRGSGVRVVTLCPGYVDTPLTRGNRYRMPFLMPADRFARAAVRAIASGASQPVIPWQMAWVARLLRLLPNALYDRLLARRGRKARRN